MVKEEGAKRRKEDGKDTRLLGQAFPIGRALIGRWDERGRRRGGRWCGLSCGKRDRRGHRPCQSLLYRSRGMSSGRNGAGIGWSGRHEGGRIRSYQQGEGGLEGRGLVREYGWSLAPQRCGGLLGSL